MRRSVKEAAMVSQALSLPLDIRRQRFAFSRDMIDDAFNLLDSNRDGVSRLPSTPNRLLGTILAESCPVAAENKTKIQSHTDGGPRTGDPVKPCSTTWAG